MPDNQNIENLLNEWCSAQPSNAVLQRRFDQAFTVDFNYNSNHLEGNTLTYGQTKLLLAALFHYRHIRIYPFEDGNGRIARLIVNYILLRHNYPMVVIPTADRKNYLNTLSLCDENTGKEPYNRANATLEQIKPFYDYIYTFVVKKLDFSAKMIKGLVSGISETDEEQQKQPIATDNVRIVS